MLKFLKDGHCIDINRLLILRSKELNIDDNEAYVLLILMALKNVGIVNITSNHIKKYSSLTVEELDTVLCSLLDKKLIMNSNGCIRINRLADKLLKEKDEPVIDEVNLLDMFQENFGRPLAPIEIQTLREFNEQGYNDEMISKALKEAVQAQKLSMRYIEGILKNWAKNGVKRRYVEHPNKKNNRVVSNYAWWDDE